MPYLGASPLANASQVALRRSAHEVRLGRSLGLEGQTARVGEITVAQVKAESWDFASTIEMKCFDQRVLELEDI
ncbi:hypothetical protein M3J09_001521 [Ascochyta lentis]